MNLEALPKILFINEESQQMHDRRIRSKVQYDTSGENPKKIITKKINNTLEITQNLHNDDQINFLAYSNKHGVMITCVDEEILLTDNQKLQSYLANPNTDKKSLKQISIAIKFSGKVYLSPNESKFLAVNNQQLMLFDISSLSILFTSKNQNSLRHFIFVNNQIVVGWNFHSKAFVYNDILQKMTINKMLEGIQRCTSINVINEHIVACEKINPAGEDEDNRIVIYNSTGQQVKNEISLRQFDNKDMYIFNFAQVLSIFTLKQQKQGQFSFNDTYGLVLGYYDDFQQQPDRRYLNFLKGNLLVKDCDIQIRGFQLFLSPSEDRTFYYNQQTQQKIPFEVQIISTGQMKIIMIEKLQVVYVVDCTQQFSKLNLYTLQPSHQIKLQDKKYFKGICLMKNMLQVQRQPPKNDSNEICNMICKQFNGQFLSLYFSTKQTQLTVPFPATLLVLGDNKIMRRYAIQTIQSVQQYEVDKLKQAIGKIKTSRYIEKVQSPVKVDLKAQVINRGQMSKTQPMVQIKKPQLPLSSQQATSTNKQGNSLFSQKLSTQQQQPKLATIFSNLSKQSQQKPTAFSLFNQPQPSQTKPNTSENLFSKLTTQNKQQPGSLFDKKPTTPANSLFGSPPSTDNKGSLFSQQSTPQLFISNIAKKQQQQKQSLSIFDKKQPPKYNNKTLFGEGSQLQVLDKKQQGNKKQQSQSKITNNFISSAMPGEIFAQSKLPQPTTQKTNLLFGNVKQQNQQQPQQQNLFCGLDAVTMFKKSPVSQPAIKLDQKSTLPLTEKNKSQSILKLQQLEKKQPLAQQQKPQQKVQKPLQTSQEKLSVQIKPLQQQQKQKQVTVQKLQQLAKQMGFVSIQLIPSPLRQLTPQQADALIQSLQNMGRPKQQQIQRKKLTRQQQARQKLLKKQHFIRIVQQIDQAKDYMKGVKLANNLVESNKIFSLKNVRQLIKKQKTVLIKKSAEELQERNELVRVVRDYIKKMQLFGKYELLLQQSDNRKYKLDQNKQRQLLKLRVGVFEQNIDRLSYYQQTIYPQHISLWTGGINSNKLQQNKQQQQQKLTNKWVETGKKKITTSELLIQQAQNLLRSTKKSQLLLAPTINNKNKQMNKSVSVATNLSSRQQNKKIKGHFAFSLQSSQNSGNQQQYQSKNNTETNANKIIIKNSKLSNCYNIKTSKINHVNRSSIPSKTIKKLLIRVKPQSIILSPEITTPLIILPSTNTSPLYVAGQFNPLNLFNKKGQQPQQQQPLPQQQPLQSSMKKSVNFNQRIPIKRDDIDIKKKQLIKPTKTIRFDYSQQLQTENNQNKHQQSQNHSFTQQQQDQVDIIPTINRTLSKLATKGQIQSKTQTQSQKQSQTIPIKKTFEKQLPSSQKKDLAKQTQQAASLFAPQLPATTMLTNANNNKKESTQRQTKPQTRKQTDIPLNLFGAASGAATLFTNTNLKPTQPTKQQKLPQPTTVGLFGSNKPQTTPSSSSVGGLFGNLNLGTKPQQKPKSTAVLPDAKKLQTQSKSQQILKNQSKPKQQQKYKQIQKQQQKPTIQTGLFGNINANKGQSLFGGGQLSFGANKQSKADQQKKQKSQQQKPKTKTITAVQSDDIKAAQKAAGQAAGQKKQTKPNTSLFGATTENKGSLFGSGSQNKGSLFGAATGGLFGSNKQQTKKQEKQTKSQQKITKPQIPATGGLLFGQKTDQTMQTKINKNQAGQQILKNPQEQKKKQADESSSKPPSTSLFGNISQPQQQPQQLIQPSVTTTTPQPQQQQPSLFGQNKPLFGAQNRFMSVGQQQSQQPSQPQQQQSTGFNPTGAMFAPISNTFATSGTSGMKSFANFGGDNKTSSLFGQSQSQQQNPLQSTGMFAQSNPFQQQQAPLFGNQPQQSVLFGNQPQQQQSTMFGQLQQSNTGFFGQQSSQGGNTNFLSGFNPTGGMGMTMNAPAPSTMLKPRK